jgi:hypothetical protein
VIPVCHVLKQVNDAQNAIDNDLLENVATDEARNDLAQEFEHVAPPVFAYDIEDGVDFLSIVQAMLAQ